MTTTLIADSLLPHIRTVLHVFRTNTKLAAALEKRGIVVTELSADALENEEALNAKIDTFDAILYTPGQADGAGLSRAVRQTAHLVGEHGMLYFFGVPDDARTALTGLLASLAFRDYAARAPRAASRYTMIESHRKWEDPTQGKGIMAVRCDYSPQSHARQLAAEGQPKCAFEVLDHVPADEWPEPSTQLLAALEMQMALLASCERKPPHACVESFYWAQQKFYEVMNLHPRFPGAYLCQAEFWRLLGNADMAGRLLRSIQHVTPDNSVAGRLKVLGERPALGEPREETPADNPAFQPRILIVNHANIDCGIDALYDGLCQVLGAEHVTEYPYKGFLHGQAMDASMRHPSMCDHPGVPKTTETLVTELREKRFDVLLYSDTLNLTPKNEVLALLHANPDVPIVLVDTQDEGWDNRPRILEYLRLDGVTAHFKREMLTCVDYGPETFPLPLAYADHRVPSAFTEDRDIDVFWAGHRHFALRRLYLDRLESMLGRTFNHLLAPAEYADALDRSRIGLDFFGLGFDTVRYWELAAHGCMLLAERKPIRLPHNFEDGISAVFFDDLPALEEKLRHYLAHPEESSAIARAGYAHMRRYHTNQARARQFLARLAPFV